MFITYISTYGQVIKHQRKALLGRFCAHALEDKEGIICWALWAERWLLCIQDQNQSSSQQPCKEFVQDWYDGDWSVVFWQVVVPLFIEHCDNSFFPSLWWLNAFDKILLYKLSKILPNGPMPSLDHFCSNDCTISRSASSKFACFLM